MQDHLARFARPQGGASEAHASYRLMAGASYAPARLQALPRSRGAQDLIEALLGLSVMVGVVVQAAHGSSRVVHRRLHG
jgi:hypothetical protein